MIVISALKAFRFLLFKDCVHKSSEIDPSDHKDSSCCCVCYLCSLMDPYPHIEKLFGADDSGYIPPHNIVHVLKLAWSGGLPSDGVRAICWRVLLGLISPSDKCLWEKELSEMINSYNTVKATVLPSLDKVSVDPLSSLSPRQTVGEACDQLSASAGTISSLRRATSAACSRPLCRIARVSGSRLEAGDSSCGWPNSRSGRNDSRPE